MAISPQRLTIYLYSAHRAVIFAIAQLSCFIHDYCSLITPIVIRPVTKAKEVNINNMSVIYRFYCGAIYRLDWPAPLIHFCALFVYLLTYSLTGLSLFLFIHIEILGDDHNSMWSQKQRSFPAGTPGNSVPKVILPVGTTLPVR